MPADTFDWNERYETKNTPWDSGAPSRELERILDECAIRPCRTLELGCGTGTNAVFLAQRGFDVTATDLSILAIEQAKARAGRDKVKVNFFAADLLQLPELGAPFEFVFDRGVYHHLRNVDMFGFLHALARTTRSGSLYLTLAGNANEIRPPEAVGGPPQVHAHDLCKELQPLFDLLQLREFFFEGVVVEGQPIKPLAWSALLRRR